MRSSGPSDRGPSTESPAPSSAVGSPLPAAATEPHGAGTETAAATETNRVAVIDRRVGVVSRRAPAPAIGGTDDGPRPGDEPGPLHPSPETAFVRVVALAARLLQAPLAVATVLGRGPHQSTSTIAVGPDGSALDPGMAPSLPATADVPLLTSRGARLGLLRIHDRAARSFTPADQLTLRDLGRILADEIALEHDARGEREANRRRTDLELQGAQDIADVAAAVRTLATDEDPDAVRRAICLIALRFIGADSAAVIPISLGPPQPGRPIRPRWVSLKELGSFSP